MPRVCTIEDATRRARTKFEQSNPEKVFDDVCSPGQLEALCASGEIPPTLGTPQFIDVAFHLLDPCDENYITDEQIFDQLEALNQDFNARNPRRDQIPSEIAQLEGNPQITFQLAGELPAEERISRRKTVERAFGNEDMKFTDSGGLDAKDPARIMNVWVCPMGQFAGYASYPWHLCDDDMFWYDGIVLATDSFFGVNHRGSTENLGRTLSHEVGHYLGLAHVWGDPELPGSHGDDCVSDTPPQQSPNFGKTGAAGTMFMNFMDYTDDNTIVMFTKEQVRRMHLAAYLYRPELMFSSQ